MTSGSFGHVASHLPLSNRPNVTTEAQAKDSLAIVCAKLKQLLNDSSTPCRPLAHQESGGGLS